MATIHSFLGWASLAATLVVLAGALAAIVGAVGRRVVDATIILLFVATLLAAMIGLFLPVTGDWPADPLHFVYAFVAVVAVPIARALAASADARRLGRYVALGALVALGAIVRLFMTGR